MLHVEPSVPRSREYSLPTGEPGDGHSGWDSWAGGTGPRPFASSCPHQVPREGANAGRFVIRTTHRARGWYVTKSELGGHNS